LFKLHVIQQHAFNQYTAHNHQQPRPRPSINPKIKQSKLTKKFVKQRRALPVQRVHAENQQHRQSKHRQSQASVQHKHTSPITATEAAPLPKPTTLTGVDRSVKVLSPICKSKHRQRT
jgi:hypothetical protein